MAMCQLELVFSTTRNAMDKCLLNGGVHVFVLQHVGEPPVLHNGCENLADTGGKCYWSEVAGVFWVFLS